MTTLSILAIGDKEYQKRIFAMLALDLLRRKILKLEFLTEIFGKTLCLKKFD